MKSNLVVNWPNDSVLVSTLPAYLQHRSRLLESSKTQSIGTRNHWERRLYASKHINTITKVISDKDRYLQEENNT